MEPKVKSYPLISKDEINYLRFSVECNLDTCNIISSLSHDLSHLDPIDLPIPNPNSD